MLGLLGLGGLIKWGVAILGVAGVFFYGMHVERQNENDRERKVIVEQLTKRNFESNKLYTRTEDIKRQAADANEYAKNDTSDADVCISSGVLLRINEIK